MPPNNQDQQPAAQPIPEPTDPVPTQLSNPAAPVQNQTIEDPGHSLALAGLIVSFLGAPFVGIFISISGLKKSKAAGIKNGLAIGGIWTASAIMALLLVLLVIISAMIAPKAQEIFSNSINSSKNLKVSVEAPENAKNVSSVAEALYATNGYYPTRISDFTNSDFASSIADVKISTSNPTASNGETAVSYQYSGSNSEPQGARVVYWDSANESLGYKYLGLATAFDNFTTPKE